MLKKPYKCEQGFVFVMKITDKIDIRLKMLDTGGNSLKLFSNF
ncbi:hypothetical protein PG593_10970 [Riemerella anatipestifer]|nr:hypothetical protein [Riemerella anatipestifer]